MSAANNFRVWTAIIITALCLPVAVTPGQSLDDQIASQQANIEKFKKALVQSTTDFTALKDEFKKQGMDIDRLEGEAKRQKEQFDSAIKTIKEDLEKANFTLECLKGSIIHQQEAKGDHVGPNTFRSKNSPGPLQSVCRFKAQGDGNHDDEIDLIGCDFRDSAGEHEQPTVGDTGHKTGLMSYDLSPGEHIIGVIIYVGDERVREIDLLTDLHDGREVVHHVAWLHLRMRDAAKHFGKGDNNKQIVIKAPPGEEVVGFNGTWGWGDGLDTLGLDTRNIVVNR